MNKRIISERNDLGEEQNQEFIDLIEKLRKMKFIGSAWLDEGKLFSGWSNFTSFLGDKQGGSNRANMDWIEEEDVEDMICYRMKYEDLPSDDDDECGEALLFFYDGW